MPALLLTFCAGCPDDATHPTFLDEYSDDVEVTDDVPTAPDVETVPIDGGTCGDGLRLLRVGGWPGGGLSLAVQLTGPNGEPGSVDGASASVGGAPAAIAPAYQATGITGIVLLDDGRELARSLVEAMPDGETFVVWSGSQLEADATHDKAHVLARIAAAPASAAAPAWPGIVKALVELGGADGPLAKTLVVAGTPPQPLSDAVAIEPLTAGLAQRLIARRVGLARVGTCAAPSPGSVVELAVDGVTCTFIAPEPLDYLAGEACDPDAAARDDWPWGTRADLVMTPDETVIYEARKAAASKEDFTGSVSLGAGEPLPATLHFRGQTSLDCDRTSYTVDFAGPTPRRLMPGGANDELFLIAMCKDVGYYNQILGDTLAGQLGIFPLRHRLVTLYVNGANQGVYLLLEHPVEALKDDATALDVVIRRGLDQDGNRPEVQLTVSGDATQALASYDAMVAAGVDLEQVSARLDLDHYLDWMALDVLLHNGDYVDEVFFAGSLEAGEADPWYHILAWDPDDLWSACHRNGAAAIPDPHGILYCAEADLDHLLYANPAIYDRFVTRLEALLSTYTIERLTSEMAAVRADLFAAVSDDATAAAMLELVAEHPEAATRSGFQTVVEGLMNADLATAAAWLTQLREKVDAYRGGP
ncbi:MAG: CotH kinase family protein [Myxococcota bacterium]